MRVSAPQKKRRSRKGARWRDLPSGGVLRIDSEPAGVTLELEVIMVNGKPRWLWTIENGQALGFVQPGMS
jgi:hypothetical protein